MTALALGPAPARALVLRRRVRLVVAATITYNAVEAVVALAAGTVAGSSALVAFGLDSVVEVLSAGAVAWQFSGGRDHREREHAALRVVACSFFGLAAVVSVDAVRALLSGGAAEHSPVGIGLAAVSLAVMPGLSLLERRTGRELGSASVVADSAQTMICAALSAVLLVGLLAHAVLGWGWADPVAALVIAAVAVREGVRALGGDTCCAPVAALLDEEPLARDACCAAPAASAPAASADPACSCCSSS